MKAVVNYHRMTCNYEQLFFSDAINSCWLATAPEEGLFSSSRNVYSFRNAGMETPFKWQVCLNVIYCRKKPSNLTVRTKNLEKYWQFPFIFQFPMHEVEQTSLP